MNKNQIEPNARVFFIEEEIFLPEHSKVTIIKRRILKNSDGFICYVFMRFDNSVDIDIVLRILDLPNARENVYQICKNRQKILEELSTSIDDDGSVWLETKIKISKESIIYIDIDNKDIYPRIVEIKFHGYEILKKT